MWHTAEQYSRSAKHSRLMNRHLCPGIAKVILHVGLSRMVYLSEVLGRLKADDCAGMRRMPVRLHEVQRAKLGKSPMRIERADKYVAAERSSPRSAQLAYNTCVHGHLCASDHCHG